LHHDKHFVFILVPTSQFDVYLYLERNKMHKNLKAAVTTAALATFATFANAATCGETDLLGDWASVASPAGSPPPTSLASSIRFSASSSTSFFVVSAGLQTIPLTCMADGTLRSVSQGSQYIITVQRQNFTVQNLDAFFVDQLISGTNSWKRSYYTKAATASFTVGAELFNAGLLIELRTFRTGDLPDYYAMLTRDGKYVRTSYAVLQQLHVQLIASPDLALLLPLKLLE
jgi:hypothetical protein